MTEYKEKIYGLFDRLFSGDSIKRDQACDEALSLLNEVETEDVKNDIRKMAVFHLLDSCRFDDAKACIDGLLASNDFYYKMAGHQAHVAYCEKNDNQNIEKALLSAIECAKQSNKKINIALTHFDHARYLYVNGKNDECIELLSNVISIATELHNNVIEQDAKYYTALALDKKGQKNMALEILREISNQAEEIRYQSTAMFSEIKRAKILNDVGRTNECLEIISQWCDNFETQK